MVSGGGRGGLEAAEEEMATDGAAEGPPQVVMVRRELLAACVTCPLCHKLLRDATTISQCLHTFCRKCIYEKLTDEEVDYCPICNIDLGCIPIEKLRPDHNLQDVRAKIFPFKRRKVNAPELVLPITLPVRRKERSLSSLVVNTPRIATQTGLTGRRTKALARRAGTIRRLIPVINEDIKSEDDNAREHAKNSSSPETLRKMAQNRRQTSSNVEASNHAPNKGTENGEKSCFDKVELWKPLNCLVEAANRTKSLKSTPQSIVIKPEQANGPDIEVHSQKTKGKELRNKSRIPDDKDGRLPISLETAKARILQGTGRRRRGPRTSAQTLLDGASAQHKRRINSIWFSLVASVDEEGEQPLRQMPPSFLRIKDGNAPVSFIQKYLVKKLNLESEAEVEITCRGQPVSPTLALHSLVDLWLRGGSSQRVQASVGTSAKDFVMVLAYVLRRAPAQ